MTKFTEARLEQAIIELLAGEGIPHLPGGDIARSPHEVLLKDDLRAFLSAQYGATTASASSAYGGFGFDKLNHHEPTPLHESTPPPELVEGSAP